MMRGLALALLIWLLPSLALAQTATIRSGEHASFTRLVISHPEGADWTVGRLGGGFGLRIDGVEGFDTTTIFPRIPRDRLAEASTTADGDLALVLGCDCGIDAFQWQPGRLVVDITDAPLTEDSPYALALAPTEPVDRPVPRPREEVLDLAELTLGDIAPPPVPRAEIDTDSLTVEVAEDATVEALRSRILDSLALMESDGPNLTEEDLPEPLDNGDPGQPGLTVQTPVISDDILDGIAEALTPSGPICRPNADYDLATWATPDDSFSKLIADRRAAVTGEFDRADPDGVVALARAYLYFGFGREAQAALAIDGLSSTERNALITLAQIMDGDPITDTALSDQLGCPGLVALWALIGFDGATLSAEVNFERIAQDFKRLPDHLQEHLSARLAAQITRYGEQEIAETVLQAGLSAPVPSFETEMAQVQITQDNGNPDDAAEQLQELAETDPRMTPQALIQLIDLQIAAGDLVPSTQLDLLRTMAFEQGKGPVSQALAETEFRALVQNQAYTDAAKVLTTITPDLDQVTFVRHVTSLVSATTDTAGDLEFLDLTFADLPLDADPAAQNAAAQRLLDLGFADRAAAVIAGPARGDIMSDRRYLRAEAALALGRPDLLEAHLAGVTTERADALRQRALIGLRETAPLDTAAAAWRAGDWETLSGSDDPLLQQASNLALATADGALGTETPLAAGRELIAGAEQARATVDALLGRFESP